MMMKYQYVGLVILVTFFVGCAQLMKGQEQPVVEKSSREGIYYTTCSGAVEDWASCNKKALHTCSKKSYAVIEKTENVNGGFRSMVFKCN